MSYHNTVGVCTYCITLLYMYVFLSSVELLKKHYTDLVGSIQDPAGIAGSLYSRGVISRCVRDEIQERDLTKQRKNEVLINAVEAQVTTDPSVYQVFMEVLGGEPYLSTIVGKMCVNSEEPTCKSFR